MKPHSRFQAFALCGTLLFTSSVIFAQQRDSFPSVDSIPVQADSRLEKDFRAEERVWALRMLLKPARETWKGREWEPEATALMEAAFEQIEKEHQVTHPLAPLAGRFRELLKKAPDDPLLAVFAARALFGEKEEPSECVPLIEKIVSLPKIPGAIEAMAHHLRWQVAATEVIDDMDDVQRRVSGQWLAAMTRSLSDASYDRDSWDVLVRHHVVALGLLEPSSTGPLESYSRMVEAAKIDDWAKLTLRGTTEVELAWMKRSSQFANEVTEAQWQGFAGHLKTARDYLGRASRLRPGRPEAASQMIRVSMGENVDLQELRAWFNRSVTAQFDYIPAYTGLLWAYRPRWGGDLQLMLAFGKACAETKRYDTKVPFMLMTSAVDVTEEIGQPDPAFRHPQIQDAMEEMCRSYLQAASSAPPLTRHHLQSHAAMTAWLADEDKLAQEALDQTGPALHPMTHATLNKMLMHERMMRAEIAADTGAYGEGIRAAANPKPKSTLEDIHAAFLKVDEKGLTPDALAYLHELRQMTGLTKAVEAGGWVDLRFHKHLTSFYQSNRGDWQVDDEGVLVSHGTGHPRNRLILRVPVGKDIEVKGEIAFEVPENMPATSMGRGIGPMLCWTSACTTGLKAMIYQHNATSGCSRAYCSSTQYATPDVMLTLKEWNTFSIRKADGKLSYEINGSPMVTSYDLERLQLEVEEGLIGFSAYRMPFGSTARIRNVSLRKIAASDLAPAPPPSSKSQPAARPSVAVSAPSTLPAGWWKWAILGVMLIIGIYLPRFISKEE